MTTFVHRKSAITPVHLPNVPNQTLVLLASAEPIFSKSHAPRAPNLNGLKMHRRVPRPVHSKLHACMWCIHVCHPGLYRLKTFTSWSPCAGEQSKPCKTCRRRPHAAPSCSPSSGACAAPSVLPSALGSFFYIIIKATRTWTTKNRTPTSYAGLHALEASFGHRRA